MTRSWRIAVLAGDGIGPEVMAQAVRVLRKAAECFRFNLELSEGLVGGAAFERFGEHLPADTLALCRAADAVLFGSVGGPLAESHLPKWNNCERNSILALRKGLGLYANLRPLMIYPELRKLSPLSERVLNKPIDILVVRELLGDLYFGRHETLKTDSGRSAVDEARYDEHQIRQVARVAFSAALTRKGRVVSVDKANVLDTSKLWRAVVTETAAEFPDVGLEHILVDNCAMQLVRAPSDFDVVLAPNMFGDILSDLVSVFAGSLGLMPSASFSDHGPSLYEPAGGSAPDIAGQDKANPTAQILSAALLLRYSLQEDGAAAAVERAVAHVIAQGARSADIAGDGERIVSTSEFTDLVLEALGKL